MKMSNPTRSLVVGAVMLAIAAAFTPIASAMAAPPIAPGATPPAGTESFMVAPCTTCHTYITPPSGGTTQTPPPPPTRICGTCHADPGPNVVAPRDEHPFLYGGTGGSGEHDGEDARSVNPPVKHVKKSHKAKKHSVKKAKAVRARESD